MRNRRDKHMENIVREINGMMNELLGNNHGSKIVIEMVKGEPGVHMIVEGHPIEILCLLAGAEKQILKKYECDDETFAYLKGCLHEQIIYKKSSHGNGGKH